MLKEHEQHHAIGWNVLHDRLDILLAQAEDAPGGGAQLQ
jgi:hypothetical protein